MAVTLVDFVVALTLLLGLPWAVDAAAFVSPMKMSLSKASLVFDFRRVPYAAGIHRIHQPPPLFRIEHVDPPSMTDNKTAILFTCSTPCLRNARVRMFASRPDESNLFIFKEGRALYGLRLSVAPTRSFESHRLQVDVTMFEDTGALRSLLPLAMLVECMQVWFLMFLMYIRTITIFPWPHKVLQNHQQPRPLLHAIPPRRATRKGQQQRLLDHGRARDSGVQWIIYEMIH